MKVRRALGYIQVASLRSANPSARQNQTNTKKSKIKHRRKAKLRTEPLAQSVAIFRRRFAFILTLFIYSLIAFWHLR